MPASCPVCSNQFPDGTEACPDDGAALTASADWQEKTHARFQSGRTDALPEPALPSESTVHVEDDFRTLTGRTLGDYVVGEKLGTGGMGEVYLADHKVIGKKVAIKFLKKEYAADPDCVNRMLTEARAVSTITHQGIIDIYNFGTLPDGRPYLVMEYLVGEPLDVVILRGALPQREAVEVLEEICTTLAAAHAAGVIHRDLKPANIFILTDPTTGEKRLKLLDFGLAKAQRLAASGPATRVGLAMGTPDYMSPEQARGVTVSAQTDLYAVGVMAFELLTGKVPFVAPSVMELMILHLRAPIPRVSSLLSSVSGDLDELVAHMMAKAPEDRPASADAVRRELKRIGSSLREQRTQIVAAPLERPERVDIGLARTVPTPAPLPPRQDGAPPVPKAAPRERRASGPALATPARVSAPTQNSFDQNELTAAALSATAGTRKVVLGLVVVVAMLAVTLVAMIWKERSAPRLEAEPVAIAEPVKVVPPEVKPEPPPEVKPEPPPEVKPEPPPEVKPEPPPEVKPEPARPLAVAKKAPTAVELNKALDRALAQPRATRMSERLITEKARLLRRAIEAAQTPVQRSASLAQIREFERQLTRVR